MRRAAAGVCLTALVCLAAVPAAAQDPAPRPLAGPSEKPEFLTGYDFNLSAAVLSIEDPRYSWDTHFGGAIDLVDYVHGRLSVLGDYEAVLGEEYRAFDPNQAYYTLEVSSSLWAGRTEIAGVYHHVSRHLSDRPKRVPIAWNVLGARVLRLVRTGRTTFEGRADLGLVTNRAIVDYQWLGDVDVVARRPINTRVGVFTRGTWDLIGVKKSLYGRSLQQSVRFDGGIRINGPAGALELFAGFERRADSEPLTMLPRHWVLAGFRVVNK